MLCEGVSAHQLEALHERDNWGTLGFPEREGFDSGTPTLADWHPNTCQINVSDSTAIAAL